MSIDGQALFLLEYSQLKLKQHVDEAGTKTKHETNQRDEQEVDNTDTHTHILEATSYSFSLVKILPSLCSLAQTQTSV